MKKRLLLLAMILLPLVASADAVEIDGIYYNIIKGKYAEVTGNPNMYNGNIVIPETIEYEGETYSVISIGSYAFCGCENMNSITIPKSVTSIKDYAFSGCTSLSSITIPNKVNDIGNAAFEGCRSLSSFIIPNSVTQIGWRAFADCSGLVSIKIGNSVISIGDMAFWQCENLTSVHISDIEAWCKIDFTYDTSNPLIYAHHLYINEKEIRDLVIPSSVTTIGKEAFNRCEGLTSLMISDGVTSIGEGAFMYCSGLTTITIPNSVTSIGNSAFLGCDGLISVMIPNSVELIEGSAFRECERLAKIAIGNGVNLIKQYAFAECPNLTDVYCYAENVPMMRDFYGNPSTNAFDNSYIEYVTLHVPESSIIAYEAIEPWKNFKKIVKTMPEYTLTYMVDDGVYKSYQVEEGTSITPEPAPSKDGFTFSGWSEIPETMPAHDVTVTGTFTINKYKLTYIVDGAEYKTYEIEYNAAITAEAEPTKEGYTFSGWSEIPETMPAHDVTVTGTFGINKYKLTYTVDGAEYKTYEVEYGTTITPEAAPTKEGYTFSGWSEIPETMPAHDVTVTGTFSINKYKLTYTIDDAEYKTYEVEYGTTITPEAAPTKEGYTFSGWSEIPETMPAHNVTVTGTFSINKYKLIYVVDGAEYKTYEIEYNATITAEAEPTKEGYTFSGWSEIPETMPAHDVTVTGTFSINKYKLTYVVDGAEYKTYEIEYGTAITPEAEPTKDGYTFSGWSEIPETMPAHDVTVTGSFTVNQYTITYIIDNEVYTTQTVNYGSTIVPPAAPERKGYDFAWGDYPETMPAYDITIYGTYTTGVESIITNPQKARVYTIDGKAQSEPQKGINIINGKKYVKK